MYIKIAWHVEGEGIISGKGFGPVVPKQHCIFECERAEYRKVCFRSYEGFKGWKEDMSFESWLEGQVSEYVFIGPGVPEEDDFELLVVRVYKNKEEWETYVAPNCYLYVMNNEGKTIDKLICK